MAFLWLINRGDPNHLLTGMILQVIPWVLPCESVNSIKVFFSGPNYNQLIDDFPTVNLG